VTGGQTLRSATEVRTYSNDKELVGQRRYYIAEQAVKVFQDKGYERTTMRDIGKACGMAPGSLYHYIGSKQDILHLICVRFAPGADAYRRYLSTLGDVSKTEQLRKCIAYYFRVIDSSRHVVSFFNREGYRLAEEDRDYVVASEVDRQSFFEQILREGIEAGEFQVSNTALVAYNIMIYAQTWVLRKVFLRNRFTFTLEEYTEEQTRILLDTVAIRNCHVDKIE